MLKKRIKRAAKISLISLLLVFMVIQGIPMTFAATPSVKSVSFDDIELVENLDGFIDYDYDEITDDYVEYFMYYYYNFIDFTVTLTDGTVLHSDGDEVTYNGKTYDLKISDDQSYNNQWGVGTHKVNAKIMGYSFSFNVIVKENPVASVTIEDKTIIEHCNGNYSYDYNYDTDEFDLEYFEYDMYDISFNITANLKDGTVLKSESGEIYYNGSYYGVLLLDEQSYDNQLKLGKQQLDVSVMGCKTTVNLNIIKSPVKSVDVTIADLYDKVDGYYTQDFDYDNMESTPEYFCYMYYPESFTVTLKDGTVLESEDSEYIEYDGEYYCLSYYDDQSYENQWGVGTHKVKAEVMGFETEFNVNVIESVVKSVEIEDVNIIEGTNGYYESYIDENNNKQYYYNYLLYNISLNYVVTLKDGTVLKSNEWGYLEYDDTEYYISSYIYQDYENQLTVGSYEIDANIMGFSTTYTLNITPSIVKSIKISDIELLENIDGYYSKDYDDNTETFTPEYFEYIYDSYDYEVTFTDGTVVKSDEDGLIEYKGDIYYIDYLDDQSYYNQWGVGKHTVYACLMNTKVPVNINIVENPVAKVDIKDIDIIEGTNGFYLYDDYGDLQYYYGYENIDFTVTLKDGTVLESDEDGYVYYNGEYYSASPEEYVNDWDVGTHIATAYIMGQEVEHKVNILKSPVKSVKVDNVEIVEGTSGEYFYDSYDNEYFVYDYETTYTVTFNDGTVVKGDEFSGVEYKGEQYFLEYFDEQDEDNPWGVGTHSVTAYFMNCPTTFNVTIKENPIKSIKFDSDVELIDHAGGCYVAEEDFFGGEYVWYNYEYDIPSYTVTFKDGTVAKSNEYGSVVYKGESFSIEKNDDQSYDNQWEQGQHKATAILYGFKTEFNVNIIPSPVAEVKIADVERIENTGYEAEDEITGENWYKYYYDTSIISVKLKDGTKLTPKDGYIEYKGHEYGIEDLDDNQDVYNEWGLGTHKVSASVMGFETSFNVKIIESPVASVKVSDINLNENTDGYSADKYDENTEQYIGTWTYYPCNPVKYTVTLKDGTVYERNADTEPFNIEYKGQTYYLSVNDTQSYENQLKVGANNINASIMGYDTTFSVNIKANGGSAKKMYGDVDRDGRISILDVTDIQKHIAKLITLDDEVLLLSDVNQDGKVNILDVTAIQKYIAHLDGAGLTGNILEK